MNIFKKISLAGLIIFSSFNSNAQDKENNKNHENILPLISYLDTKGFRIDSLLEDSRFEIYPQIDTLFTKAPEIKINNLDEYKKKIAYDIKKEEIPKFIDNNLEKLLEAEKTYGIQKEVIASIIGIESNFGEIIGEYNPFNVYISLYSKDYKKNFSKIQIKELLKFCEKNELDIFYIKSSYAGAISYGQFLPSSLNLWFIGNDLYSMDNNILSVANYLSYFKKKTGNISKAVYSYNPSKLYVQAVLALAKDAEKEFKKTER
ncbi:MAG: lytic murein transglycosylase [Nanoarchaeota archaeon]